MEDSQTVDEKMELLLRHLDPKEGVIGKNEIRKILEEKKTLKIYWGTAPTGKPHLGYFVPIFKIADFLRAQCHVTILFANLHAFLDSQKTPWELLEARCQWYELIIKQMLQTIDVPIDKLHFKRGTDFQLSPEYTLDMYRMAAQVTTVHTTHAGAQVVKANPNPLMSSLIYPMLQALDEQYLDVDVQFGGVDQIKIFTFAREKMPLLGYQKRAYLINPLVPSLSKNDGDNKMSASNPSSKIDLDDSPTVIQQKIHNAYSLDGDDIADNGLLAVCKYVLWRYLEHTGRAFVVPRPEKWGGPQIFNSYPEMERAFLTEELLSGDLKAAVSQLLVEFLEPLRLFCEQNRSALDRAYTTTPDTKPLGPYSLDIRVGTVVEVSFHPNDDRLYVGKIDLGERIGVRTIVSGIRDSISRNDFDGCKVLVCCNVAPIVTQGIESAGIILCASTKGKDRRVELPQLPPNIPNGTKLEWRDIGPVESDLPFISNSRMKKLLKCFKTDTEGRFIYKESAALLDGMPIISHLCDGVVRG